MPFLFGSPMFSLCFCDLCSEHVRLILPHEGDQSTTTRQVTHSLGWSCFLDLVRSDWCGERRCQRKWGEVGKSDKTSNLDESRSTKTTGSVQLVLRRAKAGKGVWGICVDIEIQGTLLPV